MKSREEHLLKLLKDKIEAGGGSGGKLPVSIEVTTLPAFIGPYSNGDTVIFDGMVVTAYDEDGRGIYKIPFEALLTPETVAIYDPGGYRSSLDTSPIEQPIPEGPSIVYKTGQISEARFTMETFGEAVFVLGAAGSNNVWFLVASKTKGGGVRITDNYTGGVETLNANNSFGSAIGDGYYGVTDKSTYPEPIKMNQEGLIRQTRPYGTSAISIAATIIHGQFAPRGIQSIPIRWSRPSDGTILETSFDINVVK